MGTTLGIVLFVDDDLDAEPFAREFDGELECRDRVAPEERGRVVALVTGATPIGAPEVEAYGSLRLVLTCSTGIDHLDVGALAGRGLTVCHTPTYCSDEVADHALACVLAGWRGLWRLGEEVRAGDWQPLTVLRRFDAQRLGVIGLGRIGCRLASRALALGIEVVGYDPYASPPEAVTPIGLEDLLSTSDAISLHLPGSPGTPPLLDAGRVATIKRGAVLVNLARAALVDLDAVVAALRSGALSAAAWDVWPQEPPEPGDERLRTRGLLVTPHVGWSSPEAELAYRAEAFAALRDTLIRGREPATRVR